MQRLVAITVVLLLAIVPSVFASGQRAEEQAEEEGRTLVLWDQFFPDSQSELMDQFIADFEAENPGVTVERSVYDTDSIRTTLRSSLQAGRGPDIFYYDAGPAFLGQLVGAGLVYDLTEVYSETAWDERLVEWAAGRVTYDGRIWGVPNEIEYTNVYYNKEIFEELGVADLVVPAEANSNVMTLESFQDYVEILEAAQADDLIPISFGNRDPGRGGHLFSYFVTLTAGKEQIDEILFGDGSWTEPEIVRAWEIFQRFDEEGFYPDSANAVSYDEGNALFFQGRAATNITGTWLVADLLDTVSNPEDFGFFLLPPVDDSLSLSAAAGIGSAFAISENSENKDLAVEFLDFIMTREAGEAWLMQGNIVPVIKGIDVESLDLPDMMKMVIEGASLPLAYNLDVVMPSEWNDAMKSGNQALINGTMTPREVAQEMQEAWADAKAAGDIWQATSN